MIIRLHNQDKIAINDAVDAYRVMLKVLNREEKPDLTKEHLWIIALSIRNLILNIELVSVGSSYFTSVNPKDIMAIPAQKKAAGIIMIHNHPTGDMKPSKHDLNATDRMIQVGRILDIQVIDHLIISERKYHGYYSFKDHRVMAELRKSVNYIPSLEVRLKYEKQFKVMKNDFEEKLESARQESKEIGRLEGRQEGQLEGIYIGEETGRLKGRQDGLVLGKKRGREEGRKEGERDKALSIARSMIESGESVEKIIRFTHLTKEEISGICY